MEGQNAVKKSFEDSKGWKTTVASEIWKRSVSFNSVDSTSWMARVNNSESGGGDRVVTGTPRGYGCDADIGSLESAVLFILKYLSYNNL